jgi:hypothetical protein
MGGFVVVREDQAWAVSNAVWRALVNPLAETLPAEGEARGVVDDALRGGIHWLDLRGVAFPTRSEIRDAIGAVRKGYASGQLRWGDAEETEGFLAALDALSAMFNDPSMRRPLWEPGQRSPGRTPGES